MRVAIIQIKARLRKPANLKKVLFFLEEAVGSRADLIALPEVFNYRGFLKTKEIREHVFEEVPGPSTLPLLDFAKRRRVSILAGSVYERAGRLGKAYNTSIAINRQGKIIAKYRKQHLFDANIGSKTVKETRTFLPGTKGEIFTIGRFRFGMSVCFDLRFPELYRKYAQEGCHALCVPSAFTHVTGRFHWAPLLQARAIENLCYVLAPNQTGRDERGILCFGHSMIISPWGEIIAEASGQREEIIYADLDLKTVLSARARLPGVYIKEKKHYY